MRLTPRAYRKLPFDDRAEIEAYYELLALKENDAIRRENRRRTIAQEKEERRRLIHAQSPATGARRSGGR